MGEESRFKGVAEICRTGDRNLIREVSRRIVVALFGDLLQSADPQGSLKEEEASEDD